MAGVGTKFGLSFHTVVRYTLVPRLAVGQALSFIDVIATTVMAHVNYFIRSILCWNGATPKARLVETSVLEDSANDT
jgi:hypothetical protein